MAIKYCDFTNGDDSTGDGTHGTPYKTITQASTGLSGGDEVRVAKSPAVSALAGTLAWVDGSASINTTSDLTGVLSAGDFVGKDSAGETWWEVISLTSSVLTLYKVYSGVTETVSSKKLGVTSTGEAATGSTHVQVISASGSSPSSMLKISGGWDLSTQTQDGQTYFRQMHGTFGTRYGHGLYINNKQHLEMERCHFLRYTYGIYMSVRCIIVLTSIICNSNLTGIGFSLCHNNLITAPTCNSNYYQGIYLGDSYNNIITTPVCNSNVEGRGINLSSSSSNIVTSPICNNNSIGIAIARAVNNIVTSPICNNNNRGICREYEGSNNIVNTYSGTGNTIADITCYVGTYEEIPYIKCQHFKAAGTNKCFYEHGITERDTVEARGGSGECLKYDPTSAVYYILQSFFFKADSGVAQTLSAHIKDDAAFNGDIQAAIYFMEEKITGWTEWTPTTSYVQKSIVAASGDVIENGVLELRIKVRGAAGNVYIDDLGTA